MDVKSSSITGKDSGVTDHVLSLEGSSADGTFIAEVISDALQAEAIDYGLTDGRTVTVGLATLGRDDKPLFAKAIFVHEPEGSFIVGRCGARVDDQVKEALGGDDEFETTVLSLATSSLDEARTQFDSRIPSEDVIDELVFLNPGSADNELLTSLDEVLLVMSSNEWPTEGIICSRTEGMWNDCLTTQDLATAEYGFDLDVYVGKSGVLEIWYVGANSDFRKPDALIGTIELDASEITRQELTAVRLDITVGESVTDARTDVIEIADFEGVLVEVKQASSLGERSEVWSLFQEDLEN